MGRDCFLPRPLCEVRRMERRRTQRVTETNGVGKRSED